jgi:hypothetical protein
MPCESTLSTSSSAGRASDSSSVSSGCFGSAHRTFPGSQIIRQEPGHLTGSRAIRFADFARWGLEHGLGAQAALVRVSQRSARVARDKHRTSTALVQDEYRRFAPKVSSPGRQSTCPAKTSSGSDQTRQAIFARSSICASLLQINSRETLNWHAKCPDVEVPPPVFPLFLCPYVSP